MRLGGTWMGRVGVCIAAIFVVMVAAGPVWAQAPGARGNIKVHEGAGEPDPNQVNEPQAYYCTVHIHAFKFPPNQSLRYEIRRGPAFDEAPVHKGTIETDANGEGRDPEGSSLRFDRGQYKVDVFTQQGTTKSKVFKVDCALVAGAAFARTGSEHAPFLVLSGFLLSCGGALILSSRSMQVVRRRQGSAAG